MKLPQFIAGVFGTFGFVLSLLSGAIADNELEAVLLKATLFGMLCFVVGWGAGLVAQQISAEHARFLAKKVADEDAAVEQARLEREAEAEVEAAGRVVAETPLSPPGAALKT